MYNYINLSYINILKQETKADRKIKVWKGKEKQKENFRLNTSNKALQALFFTIPLSQIYSQFNKRVISSLKLKDQG